MAKTCLVLGKTGVEKTSFINGISEDEAIALLMIPKIP